MNNGHSDHEHTDKPNKENVGAIVTELFEMRLCEYGSQIKEAKYKPEVLTAMKNLIMQGFTIS